MRQKAKITARYSLKTKLIIITSLLLILPLTAAGMISYQIAKNELDKKGEIILKNSVKQAMQLIDAKQQQVAEGALSLEDAMESVKVYLLGERDGEGKRLINKEIDLGANGYLVIYDDNGLEVMHPSLEGTNVWDIEDKSGTKFVQEQIRTAQNGGGFVTYTWNFPGSDRLGLKISYQEKEPHWGWIISASSYMEDYNSGSYEILRVLLIIIGISIVIGIIIIVLFANYMIRPIRNINEKLLEVSSGNLKINEIYVKNKDETGLLAHAFNTMLKNMKELIGTTKESAFTVFEFSNSLEAITNETSNAIHEVTDTIREVAEAVNEEAGSTESAVHKISGLAEHIETVADSAVKMDEISVRTGELSNIGIEAVKVLTDAAQKSTDAASVIIGTISSVTESSKKINIITETITQISAQTNLLALNASIEAARAGEAGKGFAVVAEEIRKLAEESSGAVQEIKEIINEIHKFSDESTTAINLASEVMKEQNIAVEDTRNAFQKISSALEETIGTITQINEESKAMRQDKDEIVDIMNNISASVEETSAATEEVSASSEEQLAGMSEVLEHTRELKLLSEKLNKIVEGFVID